MLAMANTKQISRESELDAEIEQLISRVINNQASLEERQRLEILAAERARLMNPFRSSRA